MAAVMDSACVVTTAPSAVAAAGKYANRASPCCSGVGLPPLLKGL